MRDSIFESRRKVSLGSKVSAVINELKLVLIAMRDNKMHALIPVVLILFVISFLMYFINLISPIAPFVYTLF